MRHVYSHIIRLKNIILPRIKAVTYIGFTAIVGTAEASTLSADPVSRNIYACEEVVCEPLILPSTLLDEWEHGSIVFDDINLDGKIDVIVTGKFCDTAYAIDSLSKTLFKIKLPPLCDYRKESGHLLISYRSHHGEATQDIYKIQNGQLSIHIIDVLLDKSYIHRTIYDHGDVKTFLASRGVHFLERTPLRAKVLVSKATLYAAPDYNQGTAGYLIMGDEVGLLNYVNKPGQSWFHIRYEGSGGRITERWMKKESLQLL